MYTTAVSYSADAVCCDIIEEYGTTDRYLNYNNQYDDHQLMYDCIAPISVLYCSMCNRMVKSSLAKEVYPFLNVNMWDDVGMAIRLRFLAESTKVVNKPFYHYTCNNTQSTTKRKDMKKLQEMILCVKLIEDFFEKHNVRCKYQKFLSYLKFTVKEGMTVSEADLWIETFPEARTHLFALRSKFTKKTLAKFFLLSYFSPIGKFLWRKVKK